MLGPHVLREVGALLIGAGALAVLYGLAGAGRLPNALAASAAARLGASRVARARALTDRVALGVVTDLAQGAVRDLQALSAWDWQSAADVKAAAVERLRRELGPDVAGLGAKAGIDLDTYLGERVEVVLNRRATGADG
jgi:hypothetical protein